MTKKQEINTKKYHPLFNKVATFSGGNPEKVKKYVRSRNEDIAILIAGLLEREFHGEFSFEDNLSTARGDVLFVPHKTITKKTAIKLGIEGKKDIYGGIVPELYMQTKSITHGLVDQDNSYRPEGWSQEFADAVKDVTLPGYSVFDQESAYKATESLLSKGFCVRGKRAVAAGGNDQYVIESMDDLPKSLTKVTSEELAKYGYVLESNLSKDIVTYNVGQFELGGQKATYFGVQLQTRDTKGVRQYGGAELLIVRGGFEELLEQASGIFDENNILAIKQARDFDKAVEEYLGIIASKRGYDVIQGKDASGKFYSGVLEQTFRVGGHSGSEILALEAFKNDPSLNVVLGKSYNTYGDHIPPRGARIHFQSEEDGESMVVYSSISFITEKELQKKHKKGLSRYRRAAYPNLF